MSTQKNQSQAATEQPYLDKPAAAARLGVSVRTLEVWCQKKIVPFLRIGRTIRFHVEDLDATIRRRCRVN